MNGQTISILEFIWPLLIGLPFSILTFVISNKGTEKGKFHQSLALFIIFLFLISVSLSFIIGANDSMVFIFAEFVISLALFFGFLSVFYKNGFQNLAYQKVRNIILLLINCLYLLIVLYMVGDALVKDLRSGMIMGISNSKALESAKKELNPGVHYGDCNVTDKFDWYEDGRPAPITVYCGVYFGSTNKIFMDKEILISARSGKVMYLDDQYKVNLTITKNGSPMASTDVFSGNMEKENGRMGDTVDYGVTNQNGQVTLLVYPDYINRVYTLDYKYIDLPVNIERDYVLNWDDAKQLPNGGLLFALDPLGKPWSSPYDNEDTNQSTTKPDDLTYTETGAITTFYYDPTNQTGINDLNKEGNWQFNVVSFMVAGHNIAQTVIIDQTTVFEQGGSTITKDIAKNLFVVGTKVIVTYKPIDKNHYLATKIVFN